MLVGAPAIRHRKGRLPRHDTPYAASPKASYLQHDASGRQAWADVVAAAEIPCAMPSRLPRSIWRPSLSAAGAPDAFALHP